MVWGKRGMFLSFVGSDVLGAESDGCHENEDDLLENDSSQSVMSLSSLSSSPHCALIVSRIFFVIAGTMNNKQNGNRGAIADGCCENEDC